MACGVLDISTGTDTLTVGGTLNVNGGTLIATNGSIDANGDVTVSLGTLTSPDAGGTFTVAGNWIKTGGTVTNLLGTITFDGTGVQNVTSDSAAFNNLTVNGTGNSVTLQDLLDVNGNLTITTGTLDANGQDITVAGNWSNADTFTSGGAGTVTFDGTSTVTSGGDAFFNFTVDGTSAQLLDALGGDGAPTITLTTTP